MWCAWDNPPVDVMNWGAKPAPHGARLAGFVFVIKGGVGKTTITANLGAALDAMGYRVLLIDLDLQGSLTSLFLSEKQQVEAYEQRRVLADFLAASFGAEYPNLRKYEHLILPESKSAIIPTTDELAYEETNLTIRWLLRERNRDPRFLLRKELQLNRIKNNYDVVLMVCPPLINMCCVNALAASDYLLIPILPSVQATARVPILLERVREFQENVNSGLHVMGIIANRTHRLELTFDEQSRLTLLQKQCRDIMTYDIPQFETYIRQNVEIRTAEDEHRPLHTDDSMYECFRDLAREVESRLPTFCQAANKNKKRATEVVS
jgi:chromosome partitioning protein